MTNKQCSEFEKPAKEGSHFCAACETAAKKKWTDMSTEEKPG
jgi:uncharacterized Zn finger protein (UPF0148 family)